jgi:hypothetical protein
MATFAYWLYEEGAFDSAPGLPSYARPADARQLYNDKSSCYPNEDFGPYNRYAVFGTHDSFRASLDPVLRQLRERGWRAEYGDPVLANRYAHLGASRGDIRISHYVVEPERVYLRSAENAAKRFDTVIEVWVTDVGDCPS